MPEFIADAIDRLCNVEMRIPGYPGVRSRDTVMRTYEAARRKQGKPLTYLAAQGLIDHVGQGDWVVLTTGAGMRPWRTGSEMDGPPGAASLARALWVGLGARPLYVAKERHLKQVAASSEALGVAILPERGMVEIGYRPAALAMGFPSDEEAAAHAAVHIFDEYAPKAVIAIEKLGPNEKGVIHSATGVARLESARCEHLIYEAQKRGAFTIGIGDVGNELGFGLIHDELREIWDPWGSRCKCPCGGSAITAVSTDVVVAASVSNWGAYGVAACLALLLGNPDMLQDVEAERRMIQMCWESTAGEGGAGRERLQVDFTSPATQEAVITMLRMRVHNGLQKAVERPY